MTGYERVRVALSGRPPDRVPVGEFAFPPAVAAGLLGGGVGCVSEGGPAAWQVVEEAVRLLGLDAVGVIAGEDQTWAAELGYWAGRDLFVWAVVDGPWQGLARAVGWPQALSLLSARHGAAGSAAGAGAAGAGAAAAGAGAGVEGLGAEGAGVAGAGAEGTGVEGPRVEELGAEGLLLMQVDRILAEVARAVAAGADGVVLGEDVAYAGGLFLAPAVIQERLWPLWREVTRYCAGVRTARGDTCLVCFHSDGTVGGLLPLIRQAGFDAVHSLEPEAGMDAALLVERYRGQLGLWGGLSVDLLVRGAVGEVAAEAKRLARAGRDGGLMLGTCSGVVPEGVPAGNLLAAYRAAAPGDEGR